MKRDNKDNSMDKIISLCKRRGFIFPSSEIYGGLSNSWDFGPLGTEMKNNIKNRWWKKFVHDRSDIIGMDSSIIINPKVWQASGHTDGFSDPLVECRKCHTRFRADHLIGEEAWQKIEDKSPQEKKEEIKRISPQCPSCQEKDSFTEPKKFNLMLKTFLGPVEDKTDPVFLRPETAQGIFINFKNILDSSRRSIPFGIAQIGKAFRNEITPGNYIFRTREFEQMEIEYFIPQPEKDEDWQRYFQEWKREMIDWIEDLGISYSDEIKELDVPSKDLAHYSKKTIDFEYEFPFGTKELYGLAYRTDFDLKNHEEKSKENMKYRDSKTEKEYWPHVIEPTFGVERSLLAALVSAYKEEKVKDETRIVMKFPSWLAPIKVAFLPLVKNKKEIKEKSIEIYNSFKEKLPADYDDSGAIGRRYRRQDEIGTPFCVTIDFETIDNNKVTVRERDTMKQESVDVDILHEYLKERIN